MMAGWNIFPWMAAVVVLLSASGAIIALLRKERSLMAILLAAMGIATMATFITMLWLSLERPPLRTMGETRLWYSFFLLISGLITYMRWHYRWVMTFSTMLATVFIIINLAKPEIHDQTLMPALQSIWFVPHVSIYMFSYALLGCATLLSIATLGSKPCRRNSSLHIKSISSVIATASIKPPTNACSASSVSSISWKHMVSPMNAKTLILSSLEMIRGGFRPLCLLLLYSLQLLLIFCC